MAYSYVPPPASASAPLAAAASPTSATASAFLQSRHTRLALAHVPRRARPLAPCRLNPCGIAPSTGNPKELPASPVRLQLPPARLSAAAPGADPAPQHPQSRLTAPDALFARIDPRLILSLVPMLGAFMPVIVKLLFMLPRALPLPVFNSLRLILSCACFLPSMLREIRHLRKAALHADPHPRQSPSLPSLSHARAAARAGAGSNSSPAVRAAAPPPPWWYALLPGLQLGIVVFLANAAQIIGLRYTSAGRAAFINQLSTVFVPLTAAGMGIHPLTAPVLCGALACVAGIFALTADAPVTAAAASSAAIAAAQPSQWLGDGLQLLAAAGATMYVLLIHKHTTSGRMSQSLLLSFKIFIQTCMSLAWVLSSWLLSRRHAAAGGGAGVGATATAAAAGVSTAVKTAAAAVAAVPWSPVLVLANVALVLVGGLVVNGLTSYLQVRGQAQVPPGEAAVLFATQPIWTGVFAAFILGERFTFRGMIGAALVVAGTLIASAPKSKKPA